ncbi:MAG: hypothetical protein NZ922_03980 [Candidatus Methanomethyliaceae archaeon]|nr:hypothetical protein [Candidatus Methanomethyliaceae archaeon]
MILGIKLSMFNPKFNVGLLLNISIDNRQPPVEFLKLFAPEVI